MYFVRCILIIKYRYDILHLLKDSLSRQCPILSCFHKSTKCYFIIVYPFPEYLHASSKALTIKTVSVTPRQGYKYALMFTMNNAVYINVNGAIK